MRPAATLPRSSPSREAARGTDQTVVLGTGPLTIDEVVAVARDGAPVELSDEALAAIGGVARARRGARRIGRPVYGVTTGFGALATRYIEPEKRTQLQRSLVRSHAAGTGPCVETRGRARADAAAPLHARDRAHRRARR